MSNRLDFDKYDKYDNDDNDSDFECDFPSLAMAYVPLQKWRKLYPGDVALSRGTLFEELDKPFIGEAVFDDK